MEDFMVHFNNILNHNFGELRAILSNQAVKLQKFENILKNLNIPRDPEVLDQNVQSAEPPTEKDENFTEEPKISTPKIKRNSEDDADLDENEAESSPYGKKNFQLNLN